MRPIDNIVKIATVGAGIVLIVASSFFSYVVFKSASSIMSKKEPISSKIFLDSNGLSEASNIVRERSDLTELPSSATLTKEKGKTAEVINASAVLFAARNLADALSPEGISVLSIGNSEVELRDTVIALKDKSEALREVIVSKIGTKSGEIKFERLADDYPFDIRIVIGR